LLISAGFHVLTIERLGDEVMIDCRDRRCNYEPVDNPLNHVVKERLPLKLFKSLFDEE
jgi:hypothetical protein